MYSVCIFIGILCYNFIIYLEDEGFSMIDENKILAFIRNNDGRRGAKLDQYKELIERLLTHSISKKDIYEFIKKEDGAIGSQVNFYKYISRNIDASPQLKTKINTTTEQSTVPKRKENIKDIIKEDRKEVLIANRSKTSVLKQDFNLMDYDEE